MGERFVEEHSEPRPTALPERDHDRVRFPVSISLPAEIPGNVVEQARSPRARFGVDPFFDPPFSARTCVRKFYLPPHST